MVGIYLIENLINGKKYVGQSIEIEKRWKNHLSAFKNTKEKVYKYPLYRAIRKYGINNFRFSVLEQCKEMELNNREIYWVQKLKPEYNQTLGGNQYNTGNKLNRKIVEEIQKILSEDKNYVYSNIEIGRRYGVRSQTISRINRG